MAALLCGTASGATLPEVKVVIVANFEDGADSGDAPGEFQDWVEREHLDRRAAIVGTRDEIRYNDQGVYGIVLRDGVPELTALALDGKFDLRRSYWLFTGISGVDPHVASVGSVAWARWVIDGDALREIDDRTVPRGWPYGLYAIGASRPGLLPSDPDHYGSVTDVAELTKAYALNRGLADWAYGVSRDVTLADDPVVAARRKAWVGFPNALKPPVVVEGETLGAYRYWYGAERTRWAEDWTRLWTKGRGVFVMTNEESQTYFLAMRTLASYGKVDMGRVMVLRSASDFSMPPPGASVTQFLGDEGPGQAIAFDNNERVGAPVIAALVKDWARYRERVPGVGAGEGKP